MKIIIDSLAGIKTGAVYVPGWGERVLEITIGKDKVLTPSYAISQTDVNYLAALSKLLPHGNFNARVAEIKKKYSLEKIFEIAQDKSGKLAQKEVSWINAQIKALKSSSDTVLFVFTPMIEGGAALTRLAVDLVVDVQIQSDLKIVTVPDCMSYKGSQTLSMFRQAKKRIRTKGKSAFFQIPMDYDARKFSSKVGKILKVANGVVGMYADPLKYLYNYLFVKDLYKYKIVRVLSNVPREYPSNSDQSIIPLMPMFFDIVSIKKGDPPRKKESPDHELTHAKMFVKRDNSYYTLGKYESLFGQQLSCGCTICAGNAVNDLRADYDGVLRKAMRIHETESLISVYESIRNDIGIGTFKNYINNSVNSKILTNSITISKNQRRIP